LDDRKVSPEKGKNADLVDTRQFENDADKIVNYIEKLKRQKGDGIVSAACEARLTSRMSWLHAASSSGKARDTLGNDD
jgi:hypothetical protein